MSKNTNLSFLTDFLTADIVNSRVGMNNVSPQTTFDVTGTGKFSGILTLGSTVSNGTYTYTLPSATGTLALTSDIPVVTGYVPYTGATTSVDLGDNVLTSGGLNIDSLGGYGGALNLRQATSFSLWTGAPYTSIYATTGNRVVFMFSNDNRTFTLDGSLVSAASPRTFTFPDATGTFALTSQIPANAVGGTGTLNTIPKFTAATTIGNSNIFDSGSIIYNTNPAAGQFAWQFNGSTITGQSYGAQVIAGTNASDIGFKVMNAAASINYLVVRGDGLVTLTGALNGTSAVFSGGNYINGTFQRNVGNGSLIEFKNYATTTQYNWFVGCSYNNSNVFEVIRSTAADNDSPSGTSVLSIASTGAATFSGNIVQSGTSNIIQQSASNSYTGGSVLDIYNISATGYGIYVKGGGTSQYSLSVNNYAGTNLLTILGSGAATFSSTVTAKGTGNYNGFIADNSSSSTIGGGYYSANSFGVQRGLFAVAGAISGTTDNNIGIFAEAGLGIKFFVNGSATASHIMTSGGNVLIGTTADASGKLQVVGADNAIVSQIKSASGYFQIYSYYTALNTTIIQTLNGSGSTYINFRLETLTMTVAGNQTVTGTKSFAIDHPLDDTKTLLHYSTESPKADLIYRGKINLVNGKAIINIDLSSKMTEGTFVSLCRDIQCFTTNETGWDLVKGKVVGNLLSIESNNQNSNDEISWMVIGERYDESIKNSNMLDKDGDLIVEKNKEQINLLKNKLS